MAFLTGFRNHESQYLGPLARKATIALAARVHPRPLPEMDKKVDYSDSTNVELQGNSFAQEGERGDPICTTEEYGTLPPIDADAGSGMA